MIIIIDFGSQTTHLISRRLRELSIETKIVIPEDFFEEAGKLDYKGVILSGGPASVYEKGAPTIDAKIFDIGKPILGICYGQQIMAHVLDGKVVPGTIKEYGPATLTLSESSPLFDFKLNDEINHHPDSPASEEGSRRDSSSTTQSELKPIRYPLSASFNVWMSHGDAVEGIPTGFVTIGTTETIPHAAIVHKEKNIYGIQFHPEVVHTQFGLQILGNFATICGLSPKEQPISKEFIDKMILDIKDSVGTAQVVGAMSGGVDSSIACLLVHQAIGEQFTPIYIDSGLMRENETQELQAIFKSKYKLKVTVVDASVQFLNNLAGVTDPEQKRKIIGKTFIDVLDAEAQKRNATFLVQGTIYPDVIESAGTKHAHNIKSHHNVGGLPTDMKLTLLEPIRNFYKDEVRKIGSILELPEEITHRHPFPGPGLAIRIVGDVTKEKLEILRKADRIVQEEVGKAGLGEKLWQVFAVFTGIKTTGVRGDSRAYGETIAIRGVESEDVMSVNFAQLPYELLGKISVRIVTEVPTVNRLVYDITNKPPATIEWE
ncbi:MAG TPA: glutamine-hydrolyzing GMP synthase [Candidatus Woesebacteria bacterium]|nr:glutamine-hydrolyzing GMP synthase [Candidatus Woesebacteria bacterium]